MKESHRKGITNHPDPESCAGGGNTPGEALTGAHAGRLLSSEIRQSACRPDTLQGKATPGGPVDREAPQDAAESKNLSMCGNSMHENREAPQAPRGDDLGRSEKDDHKSDMHAGGASDGPIVPRKQANKGGITPLAESAEERGPAKGNAFRLTAYRTQSRKGVSLELEGVRRAAGRDKEVRFTALLHHVTPQLLMTSYRELNPKAVPGVDETTWQEYGCGLEDRIHDLHSRVHNGTYRAKPSKRIYLPKPDGRQRPIGIAALEDKIVQQAMRIVLEQIYEEDFLGFSYGFRPERSPHNALDALAVALRKRKVNWVLDADIQGFFDTIDHEWLIKFLEHRIADKRVIRLIQKWLRAGISEEGEWSKTTEGTPQGAVISPLLANIYLHYALDLWVQNWRRKYARGDVIIVRYADDFVIGFQHRGDAERCLRELRSRMQRFSLKLHPEKTRLIEFGRFAARDRARRGEGKPETFGFLGFTHCCGTTRNGAFKVLRITNAKRMRATLHAIKEKLRKKMHEPLHVQGRWLRSVIQGWLNYHAVPGNIERLEQFTRQVARLWLRTIKRRSHKARNRWPWDRFRPT
jgi:RNA-directed DNA polymerase